MICPVMVVEHRRALMGFLLMTAYLKADVLYQFRRFVGGRPVMAGVVWFIVWQYYWRKIFESIIALLQGISLSIIGYAAIQESRGFVNVALILARRPCTEGCLSCFGQRSFRSAMPETATRGRREPSKEKELGRDYSFGVEGGRFAAGALALESVSLPLLAQRSPVADCHYCRWAVTLMNMVLLQASSLGQALALASQRRDLRAALHARRLLWRLADCDWFVGRCCGRLFIGTRIDDRRAGIAAWSWMGLVRINLSSDMQRRWDERSWSLPSVLNSKHAWLTGQRFQPVIFCGCCWWLFLKINRLGNSQKGSLIAFCATGILKLMRCGRQGVARPGSYLWT